MECQPQKYSPNENSIGVDANRTTSNKFRASLDSGDSLRETTLATEKPKSAMAMGKKIQDKAIVTETISPPLVGIELGTIHSSILRISRGRQRAGIQITKPPDATAAK